MTEDSDLTTSVTQEAAADAPTENTDTTPQAVTTDAPLTTAAPPPGSRNSAPRALKCLQTYNTPGLREPPANAGGRREQEQN